MSLSRRSRMFALLVAMAAACMLFAIVFAGQARADTYDTDFENPPFTPGSPNGQDGWSKTNAAFDHEIEDVSADTDVPEGFADQTFRISNSVTSGSFSDQTFSASLTDEAGETSAENGGQSGGDRQNHFEASFEFTSADISGEQEGLFTTISPDRGDGARMSWVELSDTADGLMVRFGDYQRRAEDDREGGQFCNTAGDSGGGCFFYTTIGEDLPRDGVYTVEIVMDFVDGESNDIVTATVTDEDGNEIGSHTGTSWEDYFRDAEDNPTRTVDSLLFRTAGTAASGTQGEGFFIDNLSLESSNVERPLVVDEDGLADIDESGNPDCDANVAAFASIQGAVDAATAGDTILVCAGTYNERPIVNKDLTINGAQAGNDAREGRTTVADESVVQSADTNNVIFNITADGVTIDGFTIQATGGTGIQGIAAAGPRSGYEILNNIVQNTTYGIYANGSEALIENNLIQDNNLPGSASGDGIYADQGSNNITVNENEFVNNDTASIVFANGAGNSDLTITGNEGDNSIVLFDTATADVSGNLINDSSGSGMFLGGGNSDITIQDNSVINAAGTGVSVSNVIGSSNTTVEILGNNITGNARGVSVADGAYTGTLEVHQNRLFGNDAPNDDPDAGAIGVRNQSDAAVDAENNWWGCNEGPNQDGCDGTLNSGSGSIDSDPHIVMDIRAKPMRVATGGSSEIIVRFLLNEGNGPIEVARNFPDGAPIGFEAMRGQVNPKQQETTNGSATTTLTTNSRKKAAIVTAGLDAESVRVRIKIRR